jgi:hypothetical protein
MHTGGTMAQSEYSKQPRIRFHSDRLRLLIASRRYNVGDSGGETMGYALRKPSSPRTPPPVA